MGITYELGVEVGPRLAAERCKQFYDELITGANIPTGHPALTLSRRMMRLKVDRLKRWEQLAVYVRAWNAYQRDELIYAIPVNTRVGPLTNETFPMPN